MPINSKRNKIDASTQFSRKHDISTFLVLPLEQTILMRPSGDFSFIIVNHMQSGCILVEVKQAYDFHSSYMYAHKWNLHYEMCMQE